MFTKLVSKFKEQKWIVNPYHIMVAGIGDSLTTYVALDMGLPEGNPLVSMLYDLGNPGFVLTPIALVGMAYFRYKMLVWLDPKIYRFFGKEISAKSLRRFAFLGLYFYTGFNALQIALAQYMGLGY